MLWKKKKKDNTDSSTCSTNPFDQSHQQPDLNDQPTQHGEMSRNNPGTIEHTNKQACQQDRADLLGSSPMQQQYDSQAHQDDYANGSSYTSNEQDQDLARLKKQIQGVKQDSLQSTRNALQKMEEAESSGTQTLNQLGTQASQIANVNRNIDLTKAHSDHASSKADELQQLNRSIFIPTNPFNKNTRQQRDIDRLQEEKSQHMDERDAIGKFEHDSIARIDQANRQNKVLNHGDYKADRQRYQFEPDGADDAVEDEINANLNSLAGATSRLKNMATTMNDELASQNEHLGKLNKKVDPISQKILGTTAKLDNTR